MIAVVIFGLLVAIWRIATKQMSIREGVVFAIALAYFLLVVFQINVADNLLMPECRYWIQVGVLLMGWVIWGVDAIANAVMRRFPRIKIMRFLLVAIILGFALNDIVMLFRSSIPNTRRNLNVKACEWAAKRIASDWQGPCKDAENPIAIGEYHIPNRPVVAAHTKRLAYVLNGRNERTSCYGKIDYPDYVFNESHRIDWQNYKCEYNLIDDLELGKKHFFLYRRVDLNWPTED